MEKLRIEIQNLERRVTILAERLEREANFTRELADEFNEFKEAQEQISDEFEKEIDRIDTEQYMEEEEGEQTSRCLVVTACYGSPLHSRVLELRRFRDEKVSGTLVGANFMRIFNRIYYSFSPQLSRYLVEHRFARVAFRHVLIAPILCQLRLATMVARPIGLLSREFEIILTGIVFYMISVLVLWALTALVASV